ncbi:hypothetical protein [Methanolobus sp.]|uniref:hypothetical protein n=1 Tax=Methanolobus sp. TaxID=1874737 RepID=UPI00258E204C|nr:hypothetical protein [Methanolobus sp.]
MLKSSKMTIDNPKIIPMSVNNVKSIILSQLPLLISVNLKYYTLTVVAGFKKIVSEGGIGLGCAFMEREMIKVGRA